MNDRVIIFDTTLRDGEQAPGASMTIPEKIEIAQLLTRLSVDVIEAGFPISSPAQREAVERIVEEVEGPIICALARTLENDIEAAGEALSRGVATRIHTFVPTSDIHIESKFGSDRFGKTLPEKRETILRMTRDAIRHARSFTDDVEFSAEDAGRTDPGFLREVIQTAVGAGAITINIPDTTGYCMTREYAALFEMAGEFVENRPDVILSTHCHDDLGLAVANSLAGVRAGARQVECTINGIGERAGNAALEEVVMGLTVRADLFGLTTGINTRLLTEASRMVSTYSGFVVPPNKAVVGRNAFAHEAGIHQHGVLKRRETYEIMRAEDVGQDAESIRLGRHSGRHGLTRRLEALGYTIPSEQHGALYKRFSVLADQKKEIFDEDLHRLMTTLPNGSHTTPRSYRLDNVAVHMDSDTPPEAVVRLRCWRNGVPHVEEQSATGDGPVDALYRAIDHAAGEPHQLVDYRIHSISEGADAQGAVTVRVRYGEIDFEATAHGTDVLQASAEAYVDALNRLAEHHDTNASVRFVTDGIMKAFG